MNSMLPPVRWTERGQILKGKGGTDGPREWGKWPLKEMLHFLKWKVKVFVQKHWVERKTESKVLWRRRLNSWVQKQNVNKTKLVSVRLLHITYYRWSPIVPWSTCLRKSLQSQRQNSPGQEARYRQHDSLENTAKIKKIIQTFEP